MTMPDDDCNGPAIRMLLVLALLAYFGQPWTWELLLAAAILIFILTKIGNYVTERFK